MRAFYVNTSALFWFVIAIASFVALFALSILSINDVVRVFLYVAYSNFKSLFRLDDCGSNHPYCGERFNIENDDIIVASAYLSFVLLFVLSLLFWKSALPSFIRFIKSPKKPTMKNKFLSDWRADVLLSKRIGGTLSVFVAALIVLFSIVSFSQYERNFYSETSEDFQKDILDRPILPVFGAEGNRVLVFLISRAIIVLSGFFFFGASYSAYLRNERRADEICRIDLAISLLGQKASADNLGKMLSITNFTLNKELLRSRSLETSIENYLGKAIENFQRKPNDNKEKPVSKGDAQ